VQGVLVYGHEPLDVIGDVTGGKAQHLRGRVSVTAERDLLPAPPSHHARMIVM
jgi:hypothetical protein